MDTRLKTVCGLVCACLLTVCACSQATTDQPGPCQRRAELARDMPTTGPAIELTGSGLGHPMVFTFEQLRSMEMTRLDNVPMRRSHEPDAMTSWQGPPLEALLTAAGIKPGAMMVTLEARDGYRIDCPRADLESAIVALKDGQGRWLADVDETCPLRLVPPRKTGNYWVLNLSRITVEPVESE
jgi:DMSO/TMAO reductase YedYZ molybdopterin-dependent catalytic subunit